MRRRKRVHVLLTDPESNRLAAAAKASGVGLSTYMRLAAIEKAAGPWPMPEVEPAQQQEAGR